MNKLLKYFDGDDMAANVWLSKYALEGEKTPDDMHKRLAKQFAKIQLNNKISTIGHEKWKDLSAFKKNNSYLTEERIYNLFKNFKYIIPQGSVMSMLGNNKIGSLSNCFVIGQPDDSYGGIMQKDQELVQLMKRRGGVGLDISSLRPKGTSTNNAANSSTGAASFMERFSNSTREVAQGGRRGALMLTIDVRHPDVMEFINIKKDRTKVTGANISVMLRDDFMKAVKNDEDYILRFPCDKKLDLPDNWKEFNLEYNTLTEYIFENKNIVYLKKVKAKEIYDSIVENAWDNAEPGQMFIDRHWGYSPDGVYPQYKGVTTNPCGEIFMQPYDACRLMALNLFSFVKDAFTDKSKIDYDLLYEISYIQQWLGDNLVDLELEHIEKIIRKIHLDRESLIVKMPELKLWNNIKKVAASGRRTGCGFTALGDMLAALGLKYDSKEGKEVIDKVLRTKMEAELDCTIDLAIENGSFEGWNNKLEYINGDSVIGTNDFYDFIISEFPNQYNKMAKYGRRNISWSTVAPTGTVSLMTQTTSGLEPLFQPFYIRRKKVNPNDKDVRVDFTDQNGDTWQEFPVLHPKFKEWCVGYVGLHGGYSIEDYKQEELQKLFEQSPWYKSTANDIDWIERVEIQAIIQKYTSHSISSTINLPNDVTKEEVTKIYLESHKKGLKGVTIYRDGCRTGVLVAETNKTTFDYNDSIKRPKQLDCDIHHLTAKGKKWTILIGLLDDKPYEVFGLLGTVAGNYSNGTLTKVKGGEYTLSVSKDETVSLYTNITEDMSDEEAVITRMISSSLRHGMKPLHVMEQLDKGDGSIVSFTKAISRTLKKYIDETELLDRASCQDCGSTNLRMEEGCVKCNDCGSSKCG